MCPGIVSHQRTQSLPLAHPAPLTDHTSHPPRAAKRSNQSSKCMYHLAFTVFACVRVQPNKLPFIHSMILLKNNYCQNFDFICLFFFQVITVVVESVAIVCHHVHVLPAKVTIRYLIGTRWESIRVSIDRTQCAFVIFRIVHHREVQLVHHQQIPRIPPVLPLVSMTLSSGTKGRL